MLNTHLLVTVTRPVHHWIDVAIKKPHIPAKQVRTCCSGCVGKLHKVLLLNPTHRNI